MNLININLARVDDDNNNNRDNRNNRDRENERDTNSNNDSIATLCKKCYIFHLLDNDNCSNKDEICDNLNCEKSRDHKKFNCNYSEESRHKEYLVERKERFNNTFTSTSTSSFTLSTSKAHIDTIEMSINRLRSNHFSSSIWILDFEITHHCSNNRSLFLKHLKKINDIVNTASDETLNVENLNNIVIVLSNKKTLTLIDVMYISDFTVNLISTSKLYHRKWNIIYSVDKSVELHKDDDLIIKANLINDLFVLRIAQNSINTIFIVLKNVTSAVLVAKAYVFAFSKQIFDLNIWHRRLIHSKYRNVIENFSKIIDMKKVKNSVSNMLCEFCMLDRQQIEIFEISIWKSTKFVIKISVDIDDSLLTTIRNNRFFILIKCYDIDMMFWFAKKHKVEIYKCVIDWITWIKRQTERDVKIIVTDDEFDFIVFKNYFKKIDI